MTIRLIEMQLIGAALMCVAVAISPAADAADKPAASTNQDPAVAAPHKIVPNVFVEADPDTLKALLAEIKPKAADLGCREVPKSQFHPMAHGKSMGGKSGQGHGRMKGGHHGLPESAFYACDGADGAQKFVSTAQEVAARVLDTHPEAIVQVGFALTKAMAAVGPCTATCQTASGPKPGWRSGALCFVCATK